MKHLSAAPSLAALALIATALPAGAEDAEIEELKAMVRSMQRTIEQQNTRIAALEQEKSEHGEKNEAPEEE
ncbi:MAG: hypothetical protein EOP87_24285, partial [Verrucomicrobiaceae bacterium]